MHPCAAPGTMTRNDLVLVSNDGFLKRSAYSITKVLSQCISGGFSLKWEGFVMCLEKM